MFDSVFVKCPKCGRNIEFQSKCGPCELNEYTLETAPPSVLCDLSDTTEDCSNCGHFVIVKVKATATIEPFDETQ